MATKRKAAPKRAKKAPKAKRARTRSQIGRGALAKGKAWEREVAAELRAIFGEEVRRGCQARKGTDASDVVGAPGWWVEAKRHKRVNLRKAMTQACRDIADKKDLKPVVIAKDDGMEPVACLRFSDFLGLLRIAHEAVGGSKDIAEVADLLNEEPPPAPPAPLKVQGDLYDRVAGTVVPSGPRVPLVPDGGLIIG